MPDFDLRPSVRAALRASRAEHGDHATCPRCELTVLVDPRSHPGRLTEHVPGRNGQTCAASGWWRCYACMDRRDAVAACTHCGGAGWMPPVTGTVARAAGGYAYVSDAPLRPGDVLAPPDGTS